MRVWRRLDFDRDDSAPGGSSGATAPWREFQGWMTSAAVDAECERMRAEATVQGGEADAEFAIDEAAALLGIAQWTSGRYLVLASTAAEVGSVGQHSVFGVSEVALVPLQWRQVAPKGVLSSMAQMLGLGTAQRAEGSFTAGIAAALSKPFALFFSRGFDLTRPLQNQDPGPVSCPPREMFVWNHSLLEPLAGTVSPGWATPVICGSFGQVSVSSFSKPMVLSLVSRRSRHFAGTRYFKRGVSRLGFVANEVELEQMVDDTAGGIASFVQLRGSVPLPWVQRTSVRVPKPPISMAPPDPTSLTGARQHFASLLARHGAPILCLNLLRKGSRAAREGPLGASFADAVKTVNSTLPPALRLQFASLDFASLSKSRSHHVLTALRASSEWAVANTGVFVAAPGKGGAAAGDGVGPVGLRTGHLADEDALGEGFG
ncbi:hypothetical protein FNF31_06638 [Cafeteria roenbergensis]|uniref:SAC domain-containing protein n=1 Tax=Cafeteria roenbergensis TaxID=33653 RepID=A0A5A8CIM1_CAFRO|nr:hypothetical protein FNF31_06638 [Cafeteria roenbergensis]